MLDSVRPARVPVPVFQTAGYFLPRLLFLQARYAPTAHWGDIALALDGFPDDRLDLSSEEFWDEWRDRWVGRAEHHEAVAAGSTTAAGRSRAHRSAAACYHWAEFMDFGDPARKLLLRTRVREAFRRSLVGEPLEIEEGCLAGAGAGGTDVPYWVVMPPAHRREPGPLPAVVLSNGLDSVTEVEVLSLAEGFLERGVAAVMFEGPGQGLSVGQTPLQIKMETVVAALLERIRADERIDGARLGFLGISFGGYLALRMAQRLGADFAGVVNLSGGPAVAPFAGLPRRLKDDFAFALTGGRLDAGPDAVQGLFDRMALDLGERPGAPVLTIHGGRDDIFTLADVSELDTAWGPAHELRVHPREAHVCLNLISTVSLEAADWLSARLHDVR